MISNDNGGEMVESEPSATGPKGQGLKKGPWSASEDAILVEYVKKHGEGNWNSVQKNSGLMRCGKSCRLRWANHLRPNLKKGSFTPEEERIIIELHAKLGNKWARMASQLPGRTDNEIKNYWNTRMKRRQRAGLPIYPKEVQKEAAAFHFQQQQQQQEQQKFPTSSSDPSLSPLLSSTHEKAPNFNPSLSLYDPTHFSAPNLDPQNNVNSSFYSNPNQQFNFFSDGSTNNGSLAFPLPSVSPYAHSPSSATLFNQNLAAQAVPSTPPSLHYDAVDFGTNISFTSLIMGAQVEPIGLINGLKSEPPSNQTPPHATNPISPSTLDNNDKDITTSATQGDINSGLLDALLLESKTLSCKGKSSHRNSPVASNKGKHVLADESKEEEEEGEVDAADAPKRVRLSLRNSSETSGENQCDDLSSFQSSMGMKSTDQEPMEEINSMDDDLLSLLNNFPSSMPLPEWYRQSREESNGSSSAVTGDVKGLQQPQQQDQDTSMTTTQGVVATNDGSPNLEWALGPRYWNNMPGIC